MSEDKCFFCGNPATKLCDFPTGYHGFIFDLPDDEKVFDYQGHDVTAETMGTCSRLICDDCATQFKGLDICPHCMHDLDDFLKANKYRLAAQKTARLRRVYGHNKRSRK